MFVFLIIDMNSCKPFRELKPAETCIICGRSRVEAGNMIVSQKARGLGFSDTPIGGGGKKKQYRSIPLNEDRTEFMVFWGEVEFWTEEAMVRAKNMYLNHQHPYFCSHCGQRVCSICGESLASPVESDYLTTDGKCHHSPLLGVNIPCTNPQCKNFKGNSATL